MGQFIARHLTARKRSIISDKQVWGVILRDALFKKEAQQLYFALRECDAIVKFDIVVGFANELAVEILQTPAGRHREFLRDLAPGRIRDKFREVFKVRQVPWHFCSRP